MVRLVAIVVLLAACPYVPSGEIRGSSDVALGETTSLRLYCDDLFDGWVRVPCGRDWQVQNVTGGSTTFGTISECGQYTAPLDMPSEPPMIDASECDSGNGCADTCGASLTISLYAR